MFIVKVFLILKNLRTNGGLKERDVVKILQSSYLATG